MTDTGPPVTINELVQLVHIGIPLDQVLWSRVTMTSDRWIAVRHGNKEDKRSTVTVLNPKDGTISFAGQTSADSVLMNPVQPIVALKGWVLSKVVTDQARGMVVLSAQRLIAGLRFEVFNLNTKLMISKAKIHDTIVFWTWVNADIIAMVTETAVYHWDLWQADCPPEKMFTRHNRLAFSEIVSYKVDPSLKWLAVTGLTPEDDRISGVTQLYNLDEDITQCISAHAVCFAQYRFDDNRSSSTVVCVTSRDVDDHGKVHVIELGPCNPGNFAPRNSYEHILFHDDADRYDFPVSLHVSVEYGLLFMLTKYGFLYLCDMETSACLCCTRISMDIIFTSTLNVDTQGILGVSRGGQVITVDLKKEVLIAYVRDQAKKTNQAIRLEKAINH